MTHDGVNGNQVDNDQGVQGTCLILPCLKGFGSVAFSNAC